MHRHTTGQSLVRRILPFALVTPPLVVACRTMSSQDAWLPAETARVVEVASSERQWTGIAIAPADGRLFVNFPRWTEAYDFAVGELAPDGSVEPYPNVELNQWSPEDDPGERFVCVHALLADDRGRLWVLDPASPGFQGVLAGGAKLVVIDLASDSVERVYRFDDGVAPEASYLNDLRIDHEHKVAYLTDSGAGAILVLDLVSGRARRLLDDHPSTSSEGITIVIDGEPWRLGGDVPQVHSDGIALSADGATLYYQALSGRTLYRVPTAALRDAGLSPEELGAAVEVVAEVGPSDGLIAGPDGAIYLSSLERNAVRRLWPATGEIETVVQDPLIAWPDSFAIGAQGRLHVTTAQIHRMEDPPEPFRILRIER